MDIYEVSLKAKRTTQFILRFTLQDQKLLFTYVIIKPQILIHTSQLFSWIKKSISFQNYFEKYSFGRKNIYNLKISVVSIMKSLPNSTPPIPPSCPHSFRYLPWKVCGQQPKYSIWNRKQVWCLALLKPPALLLLVSVFPGFLYDKTSQTSFTRDTVQCWTGQFMHVHHRQDADSQVLIDRTH